MGKRKDPSVREATPGPLGSGVHSLRRLVTEDRGATLTEIIVALFLTSLVLGLLGTAIYQIFSATRWGNESLAAMHDLEIAGVWLSRDAREALSFTPGSGTLYGTLDCGDSTAQYSYDSANTALVRTAQGRSLTVARHIAQQNDVQFTVDGSLVTVSLTSTSGSTSRNATFQISMRTQ